MKEYNDIKKELDEEILKESKNKEIKKEERKLLASEIADKISENLKPFLENDNSEKIIEAIKENKPIVNVEPPIVKTEERKYEIKSPDVIVPEIKVPKTVVNLKPNIRVKASDVKIPKIMEVRGFMDFAKLAMSVIKNKITIDASKEDPLPVQLVHDNKFYEAIGGGGGPRSVWLKKKGSAAQLDPATEDKQDDILTGLDEVEILKNRGTVSTNNSTTTPLGIDEVFTGEVDNVLDYGEVNILVKTDQDSAVGGLSIEFSPDGTNWDEKIPVNITAGRAESYGFGNRADYFRLVYTNGGVAQSYFRLHSTFHPMRTRRGARCLCVDIDPAEFAPTRRCVIAAKKPNGTYENVHSTAGANLKVAVEESEVDFPIGTGSNGSRTLTLVNTAYAIPTTASTKNHILILYNGSDTDIYVGYENTNANGILLPAGGKMSFDLGASQRVYAYCASAGKVLTYSYKELT